MSRRVRNWCDICRDLEPDIKCTAQGCGRKFHETCLKNSDLWSCEDEDRSKYICQDCKDSTVNDNTCYVCHKELETSAAIHERKKRKKNPDRSKEEGNFPKNEVESAKSELNELSELEAVEPPKDEDIESSQEGGSPVSTEPIGEVQDESSAEEPVRSSDEDPPNPPDVCVTPAPTLSSGKSSGPSSCHRRSVRILDSKLEEQKFLRQQQLEAAAERATKLRKDSTGHATHSQTPSSEYVLCDGCTNSAHLSCLGLEELPQDDDNELWFCPECDPNSATATEMAKSAAAKVAKGSVNSAASKNGGKIGGNVDICYVCQKGGKLLGCDFCEQAFHPRCIDGDFLEFESAGLEQHQTAEISGPGQDMGKWRCPICKGEDPLKNMAHRRLSRTAMMKLGREWQDCIRTVHKICKSNRDRFLWECREALFPFVTDKTLTRLKKCYVLEETTQTSLKAKSYKKKPSRLGSQQNAAAGRKSRPRRANMVEDDEDTLSDSSGGEELVKKEDGRKVEENEALNAFRSVELKCVQNSDDAGDTAGGPRNVLLKEGVCLKQYQVIGVGWLLNAFHRKAGAILADEMGLGKTIQCLTFLSALKVNNITGPHLIVVPLSTVGNWAREIRKFVPHLKFVKICGSRFEREHMMTDQSAFQGLYDLYITTYETVVTEESFFCDNFSWQCLILDEAHRIKNESGRIRHSLDRIAANMRVLLTGTPLQNNVKELFTLLNFLFPDVLKDSDTFEKVFMRKDDKGTQDQTSAELNDVLDEKVINSVGQLLGKMMMRRTKDLVVKLPKKIEHDIWLPLSPMSAFWYKKLLDVSEAAFQQHSVKKLLGTVVKMRICCCHPRGLVTRDAQLKRFREVFACLGKEEEAAVVTAANALRELAGDEHIAASSKLTVLDKLLVQLHVENMEASDAYKRDYALNVKDIYIRKNPLPPIPLMRAPATKSKKSRTVKAVSSKSDVNVGASSSVSPNQSSATDATAPAESNEDRPSNGEATTEPPSPSQPNGLTNRQQADRWRRERLAAAAAQQAQFDREVEQAAEDACIGLEPTAGDPHFFWNAMLAASQPLDEVDAAQDDGLKRVDDSANILEDAKAMEDELVPVKEEAMLGSNENLGNNQSGSEGRQPHKVLVFTQFQLVLDELEKYCHFRGFKFLRLDGSTNKMIRELDIREFNSQNSTHLVYLICTRAGGVGINLVTANHVVLFDEDWNPFIDLQAIDRAHRIGQKRDVHVWKLITEWTVEERMAFRRMQKLKLDRLLIQANTETQGSASALAAGEEEEGAGANEKFSVEEIKRLIRHGRTAIKLVSGQDERLVDQKLDALLARVRKSLPLSLSEDVYVEGETEDLPDEEEGGSAASDMVLYRDVLLEEGAVGGISEVAVRVETSSPVNDSTSLDAETISTGTTTEEGAEESLGAFVVSADERPTALSSSSAVKDEEPSSQQLTRTHRLRRRGFNSSALASEGGAFFGGASSGASLAPSKVKVERKIVYDKKCFKCGSGNNALDEFADPLVRCHRCPKVYHLQGCLGFEELPKKTWTCPWHECCLCFRKGSQAGGLLIHCAECPTTFCFDCFPPEYRKYTPCATYYADLTKRGYPVNPDSLVLFLCSRCKALNEQQRRRLLSKQQLEAEMKKRREANLKAKLDAQNKSKLASGGSAASATAGQKSSNGATGGVGEAGDLASENEARKAFAAKKKQLDDLERETLRDIKESYERLFPPPFVEVLRAKKASISQSEPPKTEPPEPPKSEPPNGEGPNGEAPDTEAPKAETTQAEPPQAELPKAEPPKAEASKTSKSVQVKLPSEFFKYCENCHLPCHENAGCPFPGESEKRKILVEDQPKASATPEVENNEGGGARKTSQPAAQKRLVRSFCPKCGVTSRNHLRRHCDKLSEEELREYTNRRESVRKFIDLLRSADPVSLGDLVPDASNAEACRRVLQKEVDAKVADCLIKGGLSVCVSASMKGIARNPSHQAQYALNGSESSTARGKKKRRTSEGNGSQDEESEDPSYSPRKRSRLGGGAGDDEQISDRGDAEPPDHNEDLAGRVGGRDRRRRPRPNFQELDGYTESANDDVEEEEEFIENDSPSPPASNSSAVPGEGKLAALEALARKAATGGGRGKATNSSKRRVSPPIDMEAAMKGPAHKTGYPFSSGMPLNSGPQGATRFPPRRWSVQSNAPMVQGRLPQPPVSPTGPPPMAFYPPPFGMPSPMMNFFPGKPGFLPWPPAAGMLPMNMSMGMPQPHPMFLAAAAQQQQQQQQPMNFAKLNTGVGGAHASLMFRAPRGSPGESFQTNNGHQPSGPPN